MTMVFRPFSRLSAAAARICRRGAIMFALLLAIPLLPTAERDAVTLALLGPFAILGYLILRDAVRLWRAGTVFEPGAPSLAQAGSARHPGSAHRPTTDGAGLHVAGIGTPSRPPHPRAGLPASGPATRRDALVWADEPEPVRAASLRTAPAGAAPSQPPGVAVEVLAFEDGVVELAASAADGSAAASAGITEPLERALRFADGLRGFSGQPSDRRDAQLGSFDPAERSGGLRIVLFSREGTSRAYVTVWPHDRGSGEIRQTTSVAFDVAAAELRAFATALSAALLWPGSRVVLRAAPAR